MTSGKTIYLIDDDSSARTGLARLMRVAGYRVLPFKSGKAFLADLTSESWKESSSITAGDSPSTVDISEDWKVGLSICYDLRFPELYRNYSEQGCNIMTVPAAFTVPTGKAHWETLLRARAIENQSYVLAAGQTGKHQDGRQTYGHSMIIDPWGKVLAQAEAEVGLIVTELSLAKINDIRTRIPALKHRRL
jgi:predicted amidohydrolase